MDPCNVYPNKPISIPVMFTPTKPMSVVFHFHDALGTHVRSVGHGRCQKTVKNCHHRMSFLPRSYCLLDNVYCHNHYFSAMKFAQKHTKLCQSELKTLPIIK